MSSVRARRPHRATRQVGQSLVEFVLVVPILIIMFVGIADFGRVFAAGIVIDGAARDAAELVAQEYLSNPPGDPLLSSAVRLGAAAPSPGDVAYYDALHLKAAKAACAELRGLPNVDYDSGTQTCATWPAVMVCIHDGADPSCSAVPGGFQDPITANCSEATPGSMTNSQSAFPSERWVEVRLCYRFTAILQLPLLPFADTYIERGHRFIIPCYFATGTADPCG